LSSVGSVRKVSGCRENYKMNTPILSIVLSSIFFVITANWKFFFELVSAFPPEAHNAAFLVSAPILLGCVMIVLITSVSNRFMLRPVLSVLFMVAAIVAYFSDHFGAMIDVTMLQNIVASDLREAGDLLTVELFLRILFLGILPTVVLWRAPVQYKNWKQESLARFGLAAGALVTASLVILLFSSHYASFFREYKSMRYYVNPVTPLYSLNKYLVGEFVSGSTAPLQMIGEDAAIVDDGSRPELMILVIGETARAKNFSLYGYSRPTNPLLAQVPDLIVYRDVLSCGTSTAVSVPCMFSKGGQAEFDRKTSTHYENVLDVLQRAGVAVLWRDNNSNSKTVAGRVTYQDFYSSKLNPVCDIECRDVGMLSGLQQYIDAQDRDILIVLHQMGNHGPAYFKRYPPEFEYFKPACHSQKLSECTSDEITNSYDNAIRYTDWSLSQVVQLLRDNQQKFETMMLYVSDHGESLGENGIYLHGLPYHFAPREQKQVPLLVWLGSHNKVDEASLQASATRHHSHDDIFQTLLNFYEVKSALTDPNGGLFLMHPND
jgi:lipid A ethanolaminephosphotransferase